MKQHKEDMKKLHNAHLYAELNKIHKEKIKDLQQVIDAQDATIGFMKEEAVEDLLICADRLKKQKDEDNSQQ